MRVSGERAAPHLDRAISLSSDGGLLYARARGRAVLARLRDETAVDLEVLPERAFAFPDQLWTLDGGELRRYTPDGRPLGDPLALDVGPAVAHATPLGPPTVVVHGRASWQVSEDCGRLTATEIGRNLVFAAPLAAHRWIAGDGARTWLRRPEGDRDLDPRELPELEGGALLVGVGPIFDGAAAMLDLRTADGHSLIVIDLRRGGVRQRVHVEGEGLVRAVSRRGQALVARGAAVTVIDLRFGRVLKEWSAPRAVVDLAVDAAGETVVVMDGDGELLVMPYQELFRGARAKAPGDAAEAAPVEEKAPETENRGENKNRSDSENRDQDRTRSAAENRGAENRGAEIRGGEIRGGEIRGGEIRGGEIRGAEIRDAENRGAENRGGEIRGGEIRGGENRGAEIRGAENRGAENRGAEIRGAENRGAENRGAENRDAENRGAENRGAENRGAENRGAENRGADENRDADKNFGADENSVEDPGAGVEVDAAPRIDRAALESVALPALAPRDGAPLFDGAALYRWLDGARALASAWCKRAIALGWDSGRISQPDPAGLPFHAEVAAILDGNSGHAAAELADAVRAADELERAFRAAFEAPRRRRSPLDVLADEFALSPLAAQILLCAAAPLLWGELARAYAIVSNDPARPLCDELLIVQLLGPGQAAERRIAAELTESAPLIRCGLLQLGAGKRPFQTVTTPDVVVRRLAGEAFDRDDGTARVKVHAPSRALAALHLPDEILAEAVAALARPVEKLRLVVRGRASSGRRTLLTALAARAGRRVGVVEVPLLARDRDLAARLAADLRDTQLRGWLPCVSGLDYLGGDDPVEREQLREVFRAHPGPILFRAGAGARLPLDPGHVAIDLPALDEDARAAAWRESLARHALSPELADPLAARYRVAPGTIERACAQVGAGGADDAYRRLADAVRDARETGVGQAASRVERLPSWSSLVLPGDVLDSLREFIGRVEHRRVVYDRWGFDERVTSARGLTALFQGGPGTGKSMVAGAIARELGYELYRVDLGRMLSKWIGETEKNLGALFDAAEEGDMVLLFDEADSLFAKRTEVRSSVDRYANIEVNYLLQRLDSFEGIAILTTNFGASIDAAFKRRLTLRLTFPFPDEEMREKLWRMHLPPRLPIAGALDLPSLAKRYQLSGGYIRNAALRAAFLAAKEGAALTQRHLEWAIKQEYRDVGKLTDGGVLE